MAGRFACEGAKQIAAVAQVAGTAATEVATGLVRALQPDITIRTWRGPSPATDVVFCRIGGAGHTWPGSR